MCPTPGASSPGVEAEGEGGVSEGGVGRWLRGGGVIAASVQLQPLRPKVQVSHCRHIHVSDQVEWSDVASIPFLAGWQLGSGGVLG